MAWLNLFIAGFKIASAIMDIFAQIQAKREFVDKMDGITAEQRVKLLLEISAEEDRLRSIADPQQFRATCLSRIDAILKRAIDAKPGEVVQDVFDVSGGSPDTTTSSLSHQHSSSSRKTLEKP